MAQKQITLTIGSNEYVAKFPNSGQLMDMDILRAQITNEKYEYFKYSLTPSFQKTALKADMIAAFNTVIPQLKKDLNVTSLFLLEEDQMNDLIKVYTEDFLPWFEEISDVLNKPKDSLKENETTTQTQQ